MEKKKKVQARTWGIIIPCEWDNHVQIICKAKQVSKYYYWIRHDHDMYTEPHENTDNPHKVGELKKPHIHCLMTFDNSRDLKTVQNYFNEFDQLKENSFEKISNAFGAKRYLTHIDNPDKYQYDPLQVETNDRLFPNVFLEKMSGEETFDKLQKAFDYDAKTMKEYVEQFKPIFITMNAWQMFGCLQNARREWRIKNVAKEAIHKSDMAILGRIYG